MGLSVYNIRKWARMLAGKSEMHVHQTLGKRFVPGEIAGYFNNMTEKISKEPALVESEDLPMNHAEQGDVIFPVTIFQYALGLYDLYLERGEEKYIKKFMQLADWSADHQETNGAWNNFGFIYPDAPYGSMCQGEGASVLIRAYKRTGDGKYLEAARKAIDFMILPLEKGGTAKYTDHDILFYEFTNKPVVLNGWIFSLFGVYDLSLAAGGKYTDLLARAIASVERHLPEFDNGYWSMYDMGGKIASPFYHDLHVSQLQALRLINGGGAFGEYAERFDSYRNRKLNYARAFAKKALQKIAEK